MPLVALVVDDSMLIRHTVCRFLEERGFSVESAANGREALEALERMNPDLIITDLQMPKMDGGELIEALKNHPKTATIPVIVLADQRSGCETAKKRADFAISKDIDIEGQLAKALHLTLGLPIAEGSAAGK